jgi:uncharacterized membrane protein
MLFGMVKTSISCIELQFPQSQKPQNLLYLIPFMGSGNCSSVQFFLMNSITANIFMYILFCGFMVD